MLPQAPDSVSSSASSWGTTLGEMASRRRPRHRLPTPRQLGGQHKHLYGFRIYETGGGCMCPQSPWMIPATPGKHRVPLLPPAATCQPTAAPPSDTQLPLGVCFPGPRKEDPPMPSPLRSGFQRLPPAESAPPCAHGEENHKAPAPKVSIGLPKCRPNQVVLELDTTAHGPFPFRIPAGPST